MSFHYRIRTIYGKELVDILRDRRTLIAMVVVPIVLYPLLMLGSIQAVSYQAESMVREKIVLGVLDEEHAHGLAYLIDLDNERLDDQRRGLEPRSDEAAALPEPLKYEIVPLGSREEIIRRIGERAIHAGVIFDSPSLINAPEVQNEVELLADEEGVRSEYAKYRIQEVIRRIGDRTVTERKREAGLPQAFDQPFLVTTTDLSSPPSILGQILPLILILMTITGAIYPAIDLTAGERERGTLESLMVSPVPVIDLIVGKFLVVTTVAMMGAALNLASVSATVYFGGFDKVIATSGGGVPFGKMVIILLCLIPFAVLMSAIMIAVCSFARTFKEAQNYVTPVILAVLVPGGVAALPATRLDGIMLVMPVGNMVLLARDFLLGANVPHWHIAIVLLSTTLYAGAAVAVAATVFGRESVVFADAGSLRAAISRRLIRPSDRPTLAMGLLLVALLFPVWFFVQAAFSPGLDEDASGLLFASGWLMPILFVGLPIAVLGHWKVDIRNTLCLRMPAVRYVVAAILIGLSAWVPAHEVNVVQQAILGVPAGVLENAELMAETLDVLPFPSVIVLIAVVPALCEELLFRGFLLSSLRSSARMWTAIVVSAVVFAVFHFFLFKFAVTAGLGIVLAYLCWRSRSILPAVLAHFLHNAVGAYAAVNPSLLERIGIPPDAGWAHLPAHVLATAGVVFVLALLLVAWHRRPEVDQPAPVVADG